MRASDRRTARPVARGSVVWQERRLIQARASAEHLGTLITGMLDGDPKGLEAARRHVEEVMAPLAERLGNRAAAGGVEARDDRAGARGGEGRPMRATVGAPMPLPAGVRRFRYGDVGPPIHRQFVVVRIDESDTGEEERRTWWQMKIDLVGQPQVISRNMSL